VADRSKFGPHLALGLALATEVNVAPKELYTGPVTLADIDPTDEAQVAAWEARMVEQGLARVLAKTARLEQLGVIDEQGRLLTDELPADMRPESRTDVTPL